MELTHAPAARRSNAGIFAALFGLLLLYVVGLDQGLLLSFVEGKTAFDQNLIHEFVHDARHSAAFPCH
jgi:cobalt transporter subunit CbtB